MNFTFFSLLLLFGAACAISPVGNDQGERIRPPQSPTNDDRDPYVPPGLCDDVHSLAGYYPVRHGKKYFYWIFESRNDWMTDPLVLWLTGGPGCSSEVALFSENGPCVIDPEKNTTHPNRWGWNNRASLMYIDQPAGVGFSVGAANATGEKDVADQMYDFLSAFFEANPRLRRNKLWIFGESYGGHYVPAVAGRINRENKRVDSSRLINLAGVGIGNGLTNPMVQLVYYPEYALNNPIRPLVSHVTYSLMKLAVPHCQRYIKACQAGDDCACSTGAKFCTATLVGPVTVQGINQYDVRARCEHPPFCYDMSDVDAFLGQPEVKKALGVDQDIVWHACNMKVYEHFVKDWLIDSEYEIKALLADGKQVLIYAGEDDYICNYMGNKAWCLNMEWPGKEQFGQKKDLAWMLDGDQRGLVRSHGNFTFLQLHDAGHMAPMDQPMATLAMLNTMLEGQSFTEE